jgi:NAD(P)-dependent dehydrogenase (short-subunit alcohol dehydrogenase family)
MSIMQLEHKLIVVTGGTRGIGAGLVNKLMQRPGNHVIATGRHVDGYKPTISSSSSRLDYLALDVTDHSSIRAFASELKSKCKRVDVLINNAGVYGPRRASIEEYEPEDLTHCFSVNALGPFLTMQSLLKEKMLGRQEDGTGGPSLIVNISTIVSSHGDSTVSKGGGYAYRASKSALNIMNKAMSIDLLPLDIYSTLLHPGYVATDMTAFQGTVSISDSADGIIRHLESMPAAELNNRFFSFQSQEIPY